MEIWNKIKSAYTGEGRRFIWFVTVVLVVFVCSWMFGSGNTVFHWVRAKREIKRQEAQIEEYLGMEDLILRGDLYRIDNPMESNYFSEAIVSKDKKQALLIVYRSLCHINDHIYRVRMRGLDPNKKYYVPELEMILSGSTLMNVGIATDFKREDFTTVIYHFEEK